MKKLQHMLVCVFVCSPLTAIADDQGIMIADNETKVFAYSGASLPSPDSFAERTVDWIKYEYVRCKVKWDQRCSGEEIIEAPQGWQACKPLYSVSVQRRGSYSVRPDKWYTNDPESPDRFRAYKFNYSAVGSGNIFDREGGHMMLSDVGLRLISADANNHARYKAGCSMPSHD